MTSPELVTTNLEALLVRTGPADFITTPQEIVSFDELGISGTGVFDKHRGHFLKAGVRDEGFRRRGEEEDRADKFNHRQVSIIDTASLTTVGDALDIDPGIVEKHFGTTRDLYLASMMGVNAVVGDLSNGQTLNDVRPPYHLGSMDIKGLFSTAFLVISYSEPCKRPGEALARSYPGAEHSMALRFVKEAKAQRGYVGVVSQSGSLAAGEALKIVSLPVVPSE
jgi:hypothetical protein